ncbi:hypothetical protein L3Q82_022428, partial [Scortum barcoo]
IFQQEALMKKHGIVHFSMASDHKASVIERFNCTLKTRMWRYFTANNTRRYLDVLQDLVRSYNHTYHKSIKMTPMQVTSRVEDKPQPLVIQRFSNGGYYDKPKDLLEELVPFLKKYDPTAQASYNPVTKHIDFHCQASPEIRCHQHRLSRHERSGRGE